MNDRSDDRSPVVAVIDESDEVSPFNDLCLESCRIKIKARKDDKNSKKCRKFYLGSKIRLRPPSPALNMLSKIVDKVKLNLL